MWQITYKCIDFISLHPPRKIPLALARILEETGEELRCQCSVCEVARLSGWAAKKHNQNVLEPPGRPPQGIMEEEEGAAGPPQDNSYMRSVSRPRCDNCLGHHAGGRGNVAICNETEREKNLKMLLGQTSSISRDRVIASEILNKACTTVQTQCCLMRPMHHPS